MNEKKPLTLKVRIRGSSKMIWEGDAISVSSKNSIGIFDVLPLHARFLTLIKNEPIKIVTESQRHTFKYPLSVLYVNNDIVTIYPDLEHV